MAIWFGSLDLVRTSRDGANRTCTEAGRRRVLDCWVSMAQLPRFRMAITRSITFLLLHSITAVPTSPSLTRIERRPKPITINRRFPGLRIMSLPRRTMKRTSTNRRQPRTLLRPIATNSTIAVKRTVLAMILLSSPPPPPRRSEYRIKRKRKRVDPFPCPNRWVSRSSRTGT